MEVGQAGSFILWAVKWRRFEIKWPARGPTVTLGHPQNLVLWLGLSYVFPNYGSSKHLRPCSIAIDVT